MIWLAIAAVLVLALVAVMAFNLRMDRPNDGGES